MPTVAYMYKYTIVTNKYAVYILAKLHPIVRLLPSI